MSRKCLQVLCAALVGLVVLSACGVSVDDTPRDIDPAKQVILEPLTTLP